VNTTILMQKIVLGFVSSVVLVLNRIFNSQLSITKNQQIKDMRMALTILGSVSNMVEEFAKISNWPQNIIELQQIKIIPKLHRVSDDASIIEHQTTRAYT
jgi:hypothetical protein